MSQARAAKNGVRADLTANRTNGGVENKEFAAFARRVLRAFGRRVAQGDVEALTDLLAFFADVDAAIQDAVDGLREFGYSWTEIACRAGVRKQTAYERWGMARAPRQIPDTLPTDDSQLSLFDRAGGQVTGDVR